MADESEEASRSGEPDSFDEVLKDVARVSSPRPVSRWASLSAGTKLCSGRFEITRRLGEGGMGVVYEAFDNERRGKVALKTLTRVDASGIYRLKNEFRALADVSHPNLVRLYELFADDQAWFFTMELVDGVRFDRFVRGEQQLREALPQLVSAVRAIHEAGKLHRDLKPSNVLVEPGGRVVVLDFGLAADPELGGVGQTVADESVSGTPAYMAPEQAAGRTATVASDWYALGVMMFEGLTGRLPFEGRSGEILALKQTQHAPSPRALSPGAAQDLSALCAELLSREPDERPSGVAIVERVGNSPSVRSTPARAPEPVATELVGRDAELDALREAYRASAQGDKPVVVLLSGESGIGKSALCERVLSELRAEGRALVLAGRCYERESVPFKALDAIIDQLSRHLRKLPESEMMHLMPREAYALSLLFPVLGRIPAFANAPERRAADPHELRRRGFAALAELLGRLRDTQPLVLYIDDLQWSDRDSTTLLMHVLRQPEAGALLFLVSHRSEGMTDNPVLQPLHEALPLDIRIDCRVQTLSPLSSDSALVLLGTAAAQRPGLASEAAGNAYLLSELGHYARARNRVPSSLAAAIEERVAELPEDQRALLEVIAVAARPIALDAAAEAAGLGGSAYERFDPLRVARLLRTAAVRGDVECYHDKIRESVAAALSGDERAACHARLARVLSTRGGTDPDQLAEHFLEAGERDKAAEHALAAARKADAAFAFGRAATLYEIVLSVGRLEPALMQALRVAYAKALREDGQGIKAGEAYLAAAADANGDEAVDLEREAGVSFLAVGHHARGIDLLRNAVRSVGIRVPTGAGKIMASALYQRARLRMRGLDFRERTAIPEPERRKYETLRSVSYALGSCNADIMLAASLNARGLRLALDAGDASAIVELIGSHLWLSIAFGVKFEEREKLADLATALCARAGRPDQMALLHFARASSIVSRSRLDSESLERGMAFFNQTLEVLREHPAELGSYLREYTYLNQALVRMYQGRLAEAAGEAPLRLEEAWAHSNVPIAVCWNMGMPARIAVEDLADAERDLDRARAAWVHPSFSALDGALLAGDLPLAWYRGSPGRAWERTEEAWARLRGSAMRRMRRIVSQVASGRASAALALAADTRDPARRETLQQAARQMAKLSPSSRFFVEAAIAFQHGNREAAAEALGASKGFLSFPWDESRRRIWGLLLGGDEGQRVVAEVDARLQAAGVKDPARFAHAMMPSFNRL